MSWNEKVDLGNWVESIVHGEPVRTVTWTTVFANRKSVRQSEFYAAANVGLKPELMYEVHKHEFKNHEMVRIGSKVYSILRVYVKDDVAELTLSAAVGSGV